MPAQSPFQQLPAIVPEPSATVAASLLLTFRTPSTAKTRARALAKRGYLGCLPFAHTKSDDLVLRLLPDTSPADAPVAVIYEGVTDGMTIAPNVRHLVAGRLAQIDYCRPRSGHTQKQQKELLAYAEQLGGEESAQAVFAACKEVAKVALTAERLGKLWSAAAPFDPLFEVIGGAWTFHLDKTGTWLRTLKGKARTHPIARNIRVGYHVDSETREDVSEDAWDVVFGDQAFDITYTGISRGTSRGSRTMNALVFAVSFLRETKSKDKRFASAEWTAAQAAVDEPKYDGALHLQAAIAAARSDPAAAYIQFANAAHYAGRTRSAVLTKVSDAALDLAKKQKWVELADVLAAAKPAR